MLGYLRTARAAAPYMTARGWGRIINISGLAARGVSTASGSIRNVAVAALTKTLADELGPHGVNVTVVHPGWTVTERTSDHIAAYASARGITEDAAQVMLAKGISIGRPVTAAELAHVVTFLASPRSVAINGDAIAAAAAPAAPPIRDLPRTPPGLPPTPPALSPTPPTACRPRLPACRLRHRHRLLVSMA